MKFRIISCLLLAVVLFSACKRGGKVIPRGTMAKIYAEMFIADQKIIGDNSAVRRMADTSFVYAPIFKKYGYTVDDYKASMEYYINDADRYARILRHASLIIDAEIKGLKKERDRMKILEGKSISHFMPEKIYYMTGLNNPKVFQTDSLKFFIDSTGGKFWFDAHEWDEKLFRGPVILIEGELEGYKGEELEEYEKEELEENDEPDSLDIFGIPGSRVGDISIKERHLQRKAE